MARPLTDGEFDHPNTMTQLGNHVRGSSILRYYHCFDALRVCVGTFDPRVGWFEKGGLALCEHALKVFPENL